MARRSRNPTGRVARSLPKKLVPKNFSPTFCLRRYSMSSRRPAKCREIHAFRNDLFADFKGFTFLAERAEPVALIGPLEYFAAFEAIVARPGLEKVMKTRHIHAAGFKANSARC
jgi:hypothetical protein